MNANPLSGGRKWRGFLLYEAIVVGLVLHGNIVDQTIIRDLLIAGLAILGVGTVAEKKLAPKDTP